MHSFYTEEMSDDIAFLGEEDARHALRVLRLREGERIAIVAFGARYEAAFAVLDGRAAARIVGTLPGTEPKVRVTLYQALAKGEHMEYAFQKCTEAGVSRFVPCLMSRCVVRETGNRHARWQRITREAGKQSQRTQLPEVAPLISFDALCDALRGHEQAFVPWENAQGEGIRTFYHGATDVAVVIGPEGGITEEEMALLPARSVSLGPRILRTETAGLVAAIEIFTLSGDIP